LCAIAIGEVFAKCIINPEKLCTLLELEAISLKICMDTTSPKRASSSRATLSGGGTELFAQIIATNRSTKSGSDTLHCLAVGKKGEVEEKGGGGGTIGEIRV
jgi:hypothetical protein